MGLRGHRPGTQQVMGPNRPLSHCAYPTWRMFSGYLPEGPGLIVTSSSGKASIFASTPFRCLSKKASVSLATAGSPNAGPPWPAPGESLQRDLRRRLW